MKDLVFNKNEDNMNLLIGELKHHYLNSTSGGGSESIKKHKNKGKLTARERINLLVDSKDEFLEIGTLAAMGMYEDFGDVTLWVIIELELYIKKNVNCFK